MHAFFLKAREVEIGAAVRKFLSMFFLSVILKFIIGVPKVQSFARYPCHRQTKRIMVGLGSKGVTLTDLQTLNTGIIPSSFIRGSNGEVSSSPKAYVNFMLLDEQFSFVSGNFSRVGSNGNIKDHWFTDAQLQDITVEKSGYIYVYLSNESNVDVFFDNLQVIHTRGSVLEETLFHQ